MKNLSKIEIDEKTFLREHCSLPPLPKIVTKIQEHVNSDNVNIANVASLISKDPALVAQILKVINSAYFGLTREIVDIKFAIAYLGLNEVYRVVLSISVVNALSIKKKEDLDRFWSHSYFTALCCKHLAKKFEPLVSFEKLWPASILHDIGKLVYLKFFPEHYHVMDNYSIENGCMFNEAEDHYDYPKSGYFGAILSDRWRLPVEVKDACEYHGLKDLLNVKNETIADAFRRIICLGNLFANLSAGELNAEVKNELLQGIKSDLNYTEDEFLIILGEIYELRLAVEKLIENI